MSRRAKLGRSSIVGLLAAFLLFLSGCHTDEAARISWGVGSDKSAHLDDPAFDLSPEARVVFEDFVVRFAESFECNPPTDVNFSQPWSAADDLLSFCADPEAEAAELISAHATSHDFYAKERFVRQFLEAVVLSTRDIGSFSDRSVAEFASIAAEKTAGRLSLVDGANATFTRFLQTQNGMDLHWAYVNLIHAKYEIRNGAELVRILGEIGNACTNAYSSSLHSLGLAIALLEAKLDDFQPVPGLERGHAVVMNTTLPKSRLILEAAAGVAAPTAEFRVRLAYQELLVREEGRLPLIEEAVHLRNTRVAEEGSVAFLDYANKWLEFHSDLWIQEPNLAVKVMALEQTDWMNVPTGCA